ncbi:MAG: Energy-coupling factor transporter ATP-binding protein EcfA2 [bacterium ADurb.Bin363]|nr:MAG: Energy-coupling factor transporter ATP-binding protein EcfA2 [bacterium ADurb.Bin363]
MSIRIEGLFYTYLKDTPFAVEALRGIDLEIGKGEFVGLAGHTGCGKSTLIQHFNGLLRPSQGKVFIDDIDIYKKGVDLKKIRSLVGLLFQYPEHQLFEETVYEDIAFGPRNFGVPDEDIEKRVRDSLEAVRLDYEEVRLRSPFSLSGGEKRRVAIAGVLATDPTYLVLDEPTAGLDPESRDNIIAGIKKLHNKYNKTVILVTHDMNQVVTLCDRIFVMEKGRIVLQGGLKEVFSNIEVLQHYRLDVPQITGLMHILKHKGLDVRVDIYTVKEAAEELKKFKKR